MRRTARVVLALVFAALPLQACELVSAPAIRTPIPIFATSIDTPDGTIGVLRTDKRVRLVFVNGSGGAANDVVGPAPNVYLVSMDGETGSTFNSFVFGIAPLGATSVQLDSFRDPLIAPISGGMFLIALQEKGVQPGDLGWVFLSRNGTVIARGTGITP